MKLKLLLYIVVTIIYITLLIVIDFNDGIPKGYYAIPISILITAYLLCLYKIKRLWINALGIDLVHIVLKIKFAHILYIVLLKILNDDWLNNVGDDNKG